MLWSQITKSLCGWKRSPYLKFSEIVWKIFSGSHKYLLVSDIGIQGMKSGQGHENTCKEGRAAGEWLFFSEAGNSGLYSWARDLWMFQVNVSENFSACHHRSLKWVLAAMIANFTHPGRKDNRKLHLSTFFLSLGIELRVCIILQTTKTLERKLFPI